MKKKGLFLCYSRCSTCKKIEKALVDKGIDFEKRDIVSQAPDEGELRAWWKMSGRDLKRFFNTSGQRYRELDLKTKLQAMDEDEQIRLLASDGKLVKRPIWVEEGEVLVGAEVIGVAGGQAG